MQKSEHYKEGYDFILEMISEEGYDNTLNYVVSRFNGCFPEKGSPDDDYRIGCWEAIHDFA